MENAIGWYHSHPGYGCWLSGIDVSTQMLNQQFQEPFVAVVVNNIENYFSVIAHSSTLFFLYLISFASTYTQRKRRGGGSSGSDP